MDKEIDTFFNLGEGKEYIIISSQGVFLHIYIYMCKYIYISNNMLHTKSKALESILDCELLLSLST